MRESRLGSLSEASRPAVRFIPFASILLAACTGLVASTGAQRIVPAGVWGGRSIALTVDDGGARVEFDCARGRIDGAIALAKDGTFQAKGVFVRDRPGPQREGDEGEAQSATYSGRVAAKQMELTVRLDESGDDLGTFTLVLGESPRLRKCR